MKDLSFRAPPSLAISVGATTPSAAEGTIVWSTISNSILIWNGTTWIEAGGGASGVEISETAPSGVEGMLWFDTTNATINVFFDGNWIESSGPAGRGIVSFAQTAGTGAPGTSDTYTFTYSDGTTSSFDVYNGDDAGGGSIGDVVGPASSTNNQVAIFDGVTGKQLKTIPLYGSQISSTIASVSSVDALVLSAGSKSIAVVANGEFQVNGSAGSAGQVLASFGVGVDAAWSTLTKSSVGLPNVDNTSDLDKPISTATQTALNGKEPTITKSTGFAKWNGSAWNFVNETYIQTSAIGSTVQAYSANLAGWSGVATSAKQDTLVNTTNIKSVNGTTLLGSGNLAVGTVTSVGLSLPGEFTVTGSPVSGSGTLTATKASQTANYFWAAPNGSNGAPIFRAIVPADIPTLNQNTTGTASNVTGTVAVANGGTGITSYTTNNYIRASGATTLEQRTPAQVLSDIGAAASSHTHVAANVTDFDSAARAQVEAMLVAGTNITLTPAGSGATRTITVSSSGGGGGGDQITVSATAPSSPTLNQLWLDIS